MTRTPSTNSTPSRTSVNSCIKRPQVPPPDIPTNTERQRRRHREHFRDVDKIQSLESTDSREDRIYGSVITGS